MQTLTEAEKESLIQYKAFIEDKNRRSVLDKLNHLSYEKNLINKELVALNEEMELLIFKQNELQKREVQLYERLSVLENNLPKIIQMYDLTNDKSCTM